ELSSFISAEAHRLADGPSFEPIAAFGAGSAYPHRAPSDRKYSRGDTALIDMGVIYKNYHADLTRMSGLFNIKTLSGGGKPRPYAGLGRAYAAVKKSRELVLPHIVPGAVIGSIAKMVKEHLAEQGFEKNTLHSAGHGIGLEVHEWPAISCGVKEKFEKGMVFTLEPGLYFKGIGGVRVEDVYVLEDKVRILG
ncbi:MAG: M24 family metallopeptidase, partial [Elusimicrobia bacterium]|nr:M24 family metallopeptidase [Elusimicrobiota bacterium]